MKTEINKILDRLDAIEKRLTDVENLPLGKGSATSLRHANKNQSLREFILSKRPADDVQMTLAIGFYLEKMGKMSSFNIGDLENALEHAKSSKPKNINDKVNKNIRKGHLEEASEKKGGRTAWYLTNSGELFVENGFKKQ
jgi:hypothetical protein